MIDRHGGYLQAYVAAADDDQAHARLELSANAIDILQCPQVMEITGAFCLLNVRNRQLSGPAAGGQDQAVVVGRSAIDQVNHGGLPVDFADPHTCDDLHVGLLVGGTGFYQQALRGRGPG
ncbi:hypothetical protein D9M68_962630 [compost metagenome]